MYNSHVRHEVLEYKMTTNQKHNFSFKGFIKGDLKRQTYFHSNGPHEGISSQSSLSKRAYNTIKTHPFEDALQEGFLIIHVGETRC